MEGVHYIVCGSRTKKTLPLTLASITSRKQSRPSLPSSAAVAPQHRRRLGLLRLSQLRCCSSLPHMPMSSYVVSLPQMGGCSSSSPAMRRQFLLVLCSVIEVVAPCSSSTRRRSLALLLHLWPPLNAVISAPRHRHLWPCCSVSDP
jgi:hypothetical protein